MSKSVNGKTSHFKFSSVSCDAIMEVDFDVASAGTESIPKQLAIRGLYFCMRSLNAPVDFSILDDCGRMIQMLLIIFLFFLLLDPLAITLCIMHFTSPEAGYFWLEVGLFLVLPIVLFFGSIRSHPNRLYWACAAVVAGFIVNRLNVPLFSYI